MAWGACNRNGYGHPATVDRRSTPLREARSSSLCVWAPATTLTHAKHGRQIRRFRCIKVLHDDAFIINTRHLIFIALERMDFDKTADYPQTMWQMSTYYPHRTARLLTRMARSSS